MKMLQVFDPPLCCPTGVCGADVDPALARFAADLEWLKRQGVGVERFNVAHEPAAFAGNAAVQEALAEQGAGCLPLVVVDGRVVSRGTYPAREDLAGWAGVTAARAPVALPLDGGCCGGSSSCC